MATQTTHFDMVKQQSAEHVSVGLLNDNFDIIDGVMFANQEKSEQLADEYNASETYNTGDYVRRENYLYKCNTDNTTGTWDATKWDRVKVMDEITQGGGGGSSTLAGLDDVNISSPQNGQVLGYNSTTQEWENVDGGGGGSSTLAGLSDVSVTGVADKDIIRYNSTSQKYEKSSALTDLELAVSQISASTLGITEGHTVIDSSGTAMAQEDGLQFASGCVEDDPVNGKTIYIEMIRISQANYNTLKANGQLKTGAKYFIYDAQPVAVNASNLPYSSTQSTKQAIDSKVGGWVQVGQNMTNSSTDVSTTLDIDISNKNELLILVAVSGYTSPSRARVNVPMSEFKNYGGMMDVTWSDFYTPSATPSRYQILFTYTDGTHIKMKQTVPSGQSTTSFYVKIYAR